MQKPKSTVSTSKKPKKTTTQKTQKPNQKTKSKSNKYASDPQFESIPSLVQLQHNTNYT